MTDDEFKEIEKFRKASNKPSEITQTEVEQYVKERRQQRGETAPDELDNRRPKEIVDPEEFSPVKSGHLKEFEDIELGKAIGEGGNKVVYPVPGREDIAIGILKPGKPGSAINEEIEELQKAASEKLPTVEVLGTTIHGGQPAIVMKKYAQGSKKIVKLHKRGGVRRVDNAEIDLLNHDSIQDLEKIRSIMERRPIRISDLQFLIDSTGHIFIADPIEVLTGVGKGLSKNNRDTIDELIAAAQENLRREK